MGSDLSEAVKIFALELAKQPWKFGQSDVLQVGYSAT